MKWLMAKWWTGLQKAKSDQYVMIHNSFNKIQNNNKITSDVALLVPKAIITICTESHLLPSTTDLLFTMNATRCTKVRYFWSSGGKTCTKKWLQTLYKSIQTDHRSLTNATGHHSLIVIWINAHVVLLQLECKLAEFAAFQLVLV